MSLDSLTQESRTPHHGDMWRARRARFWGRKATVRNRNSTPPHDASGHTWHHDNQLLFDYTKFGGEVLMEARGIIRFKSGMSSLGDVLTGDEIWDILACIRSTWPDRIRRIQATNTDRAVHGAALSGADGPRAATAGPCAWRPRRRPGTKPPGFQPDTIESVDFSISSVRIFR